MALWDDHITDMNCYHCGGLISGRFWHQSIWKGPETNYNGWIVKPGTICPTPCGPPEVLKEYFEFRVICRPCGEEL